MDEPEIGQWIGNDRIRAGSLGEGGLLRLSNSTEAPKLVWIEPLCVEVCTLEPTGSVLVETINGTWNGLQIDFCTKVISIYDSDFAKSDDYAWKIFRQ